MDSTARTMKIVAAVAVAAVLAMAVSRLVRHRADSEAPEAAPGATTNAAPAAGQPAALRVPQAAPAGGKIEAHAAIPVESRDKIVGARGSDGGFNAVPDSSRRAAAAPTQEPAPSGEAPSLADAGTDLATLKNVALHDADPERRLSAVTMLGSSDDPQVIPILAQALTDKNEDVRMTALDSLSDFTEQPPVDAIETALNDPSPDIRFEALDILSDIGGDQARQAVQRALNDPDDDVRSLAQGILDTQQLDDSQTGNAGGD